MDRERSREQQPEYWEKIRKLEAETFPEFKDSDIAELEGKKYFYFSPSWHFKRGLITESDINKFSADNSKTILSLGSGPAFLERMLVKLGIRQENITLSDIDPEILPADFKSVNVNINGDWEDLKEEKFDLIIFPESYLAVSLREDSVDIDGEKFFGQLDKLNKKKEDGLYKTVVQSLKHLKDGGVIRITGHAGHIDEDIVSAVTQKLAQEGQNVEIIYKRLLVEIKRKV